MGLYLPLYLKSPLLLNPYTNTTGSGSNSAKAEEAAKKELAMLKKVLARHPAEEMVIINAKTKETMELPEGRACVGIIRCGKAFMLSWSYAVYDIIPSFDIFLENI